MIARPTIARARRARDGHGRRRQRPRRPARDDPVASPATRRPGVTSPETPTHAGGGFTIDFRPGIYRALPRDVGRRRERAGQASDASLRLAHPATAGEVLGAMSTRSGRSGAVSGRRSSASIRRSASGSRFARCLLTETGRPSRGAVGVDAGRTRFAWSYRRGRRCEPCLPLSATSPCYLAGYSNLLRR